MCTDGSFRRSDYSIITVFPSSSIIITIKKEGVQTKKSIIILVINNEHSK